MKKIVSLLLVLLMLGMTAMATEAATTETTTETTAETEATEIVCEYCEAVIADEEEQAQHGIAAECGVEGHTTCDGKKHSTKNLDPYCPNEEDPCNACQAGESTHDCETCGKTYNCEDSGSHATCRKCGKAWCDKSKGDHKTPACGKAEHRACVYDRETPHDNCRHCKQPRCVGSHKNCGKLQAPAKVEIPVVDEEETTEPDGEDTTSKNPPALPDGDDPSDDPNTDGE